MPMPDRILRAGILTSDAVNRVSWDAEVFYRRLMSVADDYGRYDGRPAILRAALYPLKLASVTERHIERWLAECAAAKDDEGVVMILRYQVAGRSYVQVEKFRQRVRAASKWPNPLTSADNSEQLLSFAAHSDIPASVPNTTTHTPTTTPTKKGVQGETEAEEILTYLNRKSGHTFEAVAVNLNFIRARLAEGATVAQCRAVIDGKARQWGCEPSMRKYLRPATLFNATKFAQYVGELKAAPPLVKAAHDTPLVAPEPVIHRDTRGLVTSVADRKGISSS